MACTVVWWLAPSPHRKRLPGLNPGVFLWGVLHVLPRAWDLYGYSGFLPLPKNMRVRLIGDFKLSLGVSVDGY